MTATEVETTYDVVGAIRAKAGPIVSELVDMSARLSWILGKFDDLDTTVATLISPDDGKPWEALREVTGVAAMLSLLLHIGAMVDAKIGSSGDLLLEAGRWHTRQRLLAALDPPEGLLPGNS